MKTVTKVLAALIAVLGMIGPAIAPALQHAISVHPLAASIIAAVTSILALFHNPVATA
jgi:hypothetical protein